ncbi:hypothetical protein [Thauera sinica]|uniref:Uncharacterized protein n=1 Tax=Thauera sinica TaxID=2665146 RepID=A0ABW1AR63_9RHOO|nr:hypothetical protein [Thauera sp. K11]
MSSILHQGGLLGAGAAVLGGVAEAAEAADTLMDAVSPWGLLRSEGLGRCISAGVCSDVLSGSNFGPSSSYGGLPLYPNNANTNMMQSVYSKIPVHLLRLILDFFFLPVLMWVGSVFAGFQWRNPSIGFQQSMITGLLMLGVLLALSYQTGYMGYYKIGRRRYFYMVFVVPIVVGLFGLLASTIFGHD